MAIPVIRLFLALAMGVTLGSCAVGVVRLTEPEPSPAAVSPSSAPAQSAAASSPAAPAAPAQSAPPPPSPPPPEPEPAAHKTVEEIRGECWMKAEANRSVRDIDARLKYVQNCVDERARGDSQPAGGERTRRR